MATYQGQFVDNRSAAKAKLAEAINKSTANTQAVLQRVYDDVPEDAIVKGQALAFENAGKTLAMGAGGQDWTLHNNALGQLAERAGIPTKYARTLEDGDNWQRDLLAHALRETYSHGDSRYLVRSIRGEARGFLSDRYRRLDTRPILETFVDGAMQRGAIPYSATGTDVRVALKAIHPEIFEPIPGEFMVFGAEWHNSDFGKGSHEMRIFLLRIWCLNGCTAENVMRQVHLGGRLDDDLLFSEKTYQLDRETIQSAVQDTVSSVFSREGREKQIARIRAAADEETTWAPIQAKLAKQLTKDELRMAGEAFNGPDVQNLPAGKSMWRASNALSWIAQQVDSPERRLELERLSGVLV